MDRRYKTLLPALRTSPGQSEGGEQSPSATKRKRIYVKTACDVCRIKKTACDGQRPACTPCVKRKSPCTFGGRPAGSDEARSPGGANINHDTDSASIVTALLTSHDAEAHELLDKMRLGRGTLELLGPWAEEEDENGKGPIMVPPDQTSFEFELMVKHPIAYPVLVPLDSHSQNNSTNGQSRMMQTQTMEPELDGAARKEGLEGHNSELARELQYEERLRHVHFARWTNVAISGSEAASAIAKYLAHEHVLLQLFDTELFLKDVAHDYGDLCSSLLINALLSWSLPSIDITDSERRDPAGAAYETAIRQLDAQDDRPACLSTLVAAEFLSLTALFRGEGARSRRLFRQALNMAQEMHLLAGSHGGRGTLEADDENMPKATVSWGLFSLATMLSFYCQRNELPPNLLPAWHPPDVEIAERNSISAVITGHMRNLWAIIHDINFQYYREGKNIANEVTTPFVSATLVRLLRWADKLPNLLARGNRSTQEVMLMQ